MKPAQPVLQAAPKVVLQAVPAVPAILQKQAPPKPAEKPHQAKPVPPKGKLEGKVYKFPAKQPRTEPTDDIFWGRQFDWCANGMPQIFDVAFKRTFAPEFSGAIDWSGKCPPSVFMKAMHCDV